MTGSSSLTAFHSHAGVASHQLLGELPSVDQTKRISVDLSILSSGRSSATSLLAGCLWSEQANDAQFSHRGGALWRIVGKSRKTDTLCKSTPCLFDCLGLGKRKPVALLSLWPSAALQEVVKEQRGATEKRQTAGACRQCCSRHANFKEGFLKVFLHTP